MRHAAKLTTGEVMRAEPAEGQRVPVNVLGTLQDPVIGLYMRVGVQVGAERYVLYMRS